MTQRRDWGPYSGATRTTHTLKIDRTIEELSRKPYRIRDGSIRQTIQRIKEEEVRVGDRVEIITADEAAYLLGGFEVVDVFNIELHHTGIMLEGPVVDAFHPWHQLNKLAARDGIEPPTGDALGKVMVKCYGDKLDDGLPAQIIRW